MKSSFWLFYIHEFSFILFAKDLDILNINIYLFDLYSTFPLRRGSQGGYQKK